MRSPCTGLEARTAPCPCCHKKDQKGRYLPAPALTLHVHHGWLGKSSLTPLPIIHHLSDFTCWFRVGTTLSTSPGCKDLQNAPAGKWRASGSVLAVFQAWVPMPFPTETLGMACPCFNPFRDQALMPGCCCLLPPVKGLHHFFQRKG